MTILGFPGLSAPLLSSAIRLGLLALPLPAPEPREVFLRQKAGCSSSSPCFLSLRENWPSLSVNSTLQNTVYITRLYFDCFRKEDKSCSPNWPEVKDNWLCWVWVTRSHFLWWVIFDWILQTVDFTMFSTGFVIPFQWMLGLFSSVLLSFPPWTLILVSSQLSRVPRLCLGAPGFTAAQRLPPGRQPEKGQHSSLLLTFS